MTSFLRRYNWGAGAILSNGKRMVYGLLGGMFLLGFSACNVTKHLEKDQSGPLLVKNTIELKTDKPLPLDQKTPLLYELGALYRQKPNERNLLAFGTPVRLWYYYRYRDGKGKWARWIMKKIAEPPAIYDQELAIRTSNNLQNYMRQRGYFNAQSTYAVKFSPNRFHKQPDSLDRRPSKAAVTYTLSLGQQYKIGRVSYDSRDSNVLRILQLTAGGSLLKPGAPLDSRNFDAEKVRITNEMKNRGYAFFIPRFVEFVGDSTKNLADVTVEVLQQSDSSLHKTYTIGNIAVFSDLVPDLFSIRKDTTIEGIYFATSDPDFEVKPFRIYNAITLRPGMQYRQEDFDKTAHNLNALGIFKFVTIRPSQDSIQPEKIDVAISFALTNRFPLGWDAGLNSSTNSGSTLSGRLLGASASGSAVNRNLFHGAENIQTNLGYSLEFDLSPGSNNLLFSQDIKLQNELTFPRYFDYLGLWRNLDRFNLIRSSFYKQLQNDGQVRIGLNYNYLDLRGFYVYNLFNAAFGYTLRTNTGDQYNFDNIGIDILRPQLRPRFDSLFGKNEFLIRSFGNQLFTGVLMRSFTYTYSGRPNAFGERWFFRLSTELSGMEIYAINRLWTVPFPEQTWTLSDLEFSKFGKLEVTGSYTREFSPNLTGAVRVGAGAVLPFGDTRNVPYVKQFFVGGPSSIRAWRIRELGPGGNPVDASVQPFFQAADFRFEFSGELRFPLFWWMKGAVFVDGGNIWTFKDDPERPNAKLRADSYKNIALGTGFGLRFDFDYFVFRFDWGLKLRRPYLLEGEGYWVDWTGASWRSISNFNLAVGYPF
ncbi:MAG: BamA/TamA family outer membrane protein [Saprospiraceae bacterium]|nr:BamA/TamA family outer membrane protein [Saprospiraceae bacterium]